MAPLGKRRPAVEATGKGEQVPELKKEACRGGCVTLHYQPSQVLFPDPRFDCHIINGRALASVSCAVVRVGLGLG